MPLLCNVPAPILISLFCFLCSISQQTILIGEDEHMDQLNNNLTAALKSSLNELLKSDLQLRGSVSLHTVEPFHIRTSILNASIWELHDVSTKLRLVYGGKFAGIVLNFQLVFPVIGTVCNSQSALFLSTTPYSTESCSALSRSRPRFRSVTRDEPDKPIQELHDVGDVARVLLAAVIDRIVKMPTKVVREVLQKL